jgi:hypothetical protein
MIAINHLALSDRCLNELDDVQRTQRANSHSKSLYLQNTSQNIMTFYKTLFLSILLLATPTIQAQTQFKQFGTKIFDENGRTIKLSDAIEISKPKSEKAYIAFKLAENLRDERQRSLIFGYLWGAAAIVPSRVSAIERQPIYTSLNGLYAGASIGNFYLAPKKKEIEEVLALGVKAFNESSTTNE